MTKAEIIQEAQRAEARLKEIAKTRRPTEAETEEARKAYAAAAAAEKEN